MSICTRAFAPAFLSLILLLAACASVPKIAPAVPLAPAAKAPPAHPRLTVQKFGELPGWSQPQPANDAAALTAFLKSCPAVTRKADRSGLTQPGDWMEACTAATAWNPADAHRFFELYFQPVRVTNGEAFATGYYEPEIAGSRTLGPGYPAPVYRRPAELVDIDLGGFGADLKGKKLRGRFVGDRLLPFHDRGAIYDGALAGKGLEIAWAADPIELFFLQIQGSGRLTLPDGTVMRIGYDGQNGRDYLAIGKRLRDTGRLAPGQATMDGIIGWLRANPAEGQALMRENKSYVFFRELTGDGPLGALGAALTPGASVATDPTFTPLGTPLWLELGAAAGPQAGAKLWVAQDVGGAIKGANRFDTFWGAGAQARVTAGGMSAGGRAWLLLPRAAVRRIEEGAGGYGTAARP